MPKVNSFKFYSVPPNASVRWVSTNFIHLNLSTLEMTDIKQYDDSRQNNSGGQAFFNGISLKMGKGTIHLSIPLVDFDIFHITIENASKMTGQTKAHVYFQIDNWTITNNVDTITLKIVEKPKLNGKKSSAKSINFSSRNAVKADIEKIVSVLFAGCYQIL